MSTVTQPDYIYDEMPTVLDGWGDRVRNGVWPISLPLWMAAFWVAMFLIRPWEKLIPELASLHPARIYAVAMIGVVVLSGRLRMMMSFQTLTVFIFIGALALSYFAAYDQSRAWADLYRYLTLIVFYFILISVIRTPYQLAFLATCYLVITTFYLALSEYEYFFHDSHQYRMGVRRLIGVDLTFNGPNEVAGSTVLSFPIAWAMWKTRHAFTETWPATLRRLFPYCLGIYALICLSAIVLTNSRGGVLGVLVFLALVVLSGRGIGKKLLISICLVGVVWVAMPEEHRNRVRTIWNPDVGPRNAARSAEGRIEGFRAGLEMFKQHKFAGVGLGCFALYRFHYVDGNPEEAHNLLGQTLGETGIVGTLAFSLLIVAVFANSVTTLTLTRGREDDPSVAIIREITIACVMTVLVLLYFGILSHNMLRFNWLWVAAFALLCREFAKQIIPTTDPDEGAPLEELSGQLS